MNEHWKVLSLFSSLSLWGWNIKVLGGSWVRGMCDILQEERKYGYKARRGGREWEGVLCAVGASLVVDCKVGLVRTCQTILFCFLCWLWRQQTVGDIEYDIFWGMGICNGHNWTSDKKLARLYLRKVCLLNYHLIFILDCTRKICKM